MISRRVFAVVIGIVAMTLAGCVGPTGVRRPEPPGETVVPE